MRPAMLEKTENCCGIYRITCKVNGKSYVGSAVRMRHRWSLHLKELRENRHHSVLLQHTWNKYGEQSFKWKIIERVPRQAWLVSREQKHLDTLFASGKQLNISPTAGSSLGVKRKYKRQFSDATKLKMSETRRGRKHSTAHAKAISKGKLASGYTHSAATREKMAAAKRGTKQSAATRRKRSESLKGRVFSKEHKAKISAAKRAAWA